MKDRSASPPFDNRILEALHQVTLDLINRHELSEILERLLVQSADLLDAPSVSIDLLEDEEVIVTYAATPGQPLEVGDRMRRGEGGFLSWQAMDTRQPAMLADYSTWAKRRALYDNFPIHAILIMPILRGDHAIGAINLLRFRAGQTFSEADISIAERLAQTAALMLDNARMYAQLTSELEKHKRAEAALRDTQAQITEKEHALAALQEREHLARELHNGLGQTLGYINLQANLTQELLRKQDLAGAERMMSKLGQAAQQAHREVRQYIGALQQHPAEPVAPQDFFSALQQYCQHLELTYQFRVKLVLPRARPEVLASAEVEAQLTHILHEALHNARKHSGASQASVTVEVDEAMVQAVVKDEGIGLGGTYQGPERRQGAHFGMGIMRACAEEVGGTLLIQSASGIGTHIIARLPRRLTSLNLPPTRLLIVDDHPLFRDGLRNLLTTRGVQVVGLAGDGVEAQAMTRALHPDILLMDINMPRLNGLEATRLLKAELPKVKIVILTTTLDEVHLFEALRAGASGYLFKGMCADEFMTALGDIARGEAELSADLANKILQEFASPISENRPMLGPPESLPIGQMRLTDRQLDVLRLLTQGLQYKEIGARLFLTERTIKYHMGEILARLHVASRREALAYAKRQGWVE